MKFVQLVQLPPRLRSTTVAIAASRAGAVGVINAELESDHCRVIEELTEVNHLARGPFGVSLDKIHGELGETLHRLAREQLKWIILSGESVSTEQLAGLRALGVRVLLRVTDTRIPEGLTEADGLVVKGHEASGFVGEDSSFILLQKWLKRTQLPLFVHGGISPHSAAACKAGGAAGVILDSQMLLLDELRLDKSVKALLSGLSGSETVAAGDAETGEYFRVLVRPNNLVARKFVDDTSVASSVALREALADLAKYPTDWSSPGSTLIPLGQDVSFARSWGARYGNVAGVCRAIDEAIVANLRIAAESRVISEGSPLARRWGTRFPLVQGPMTRVSDSAPFAAAVAGAGALPMVAFALLRGPRLEQLLEETKVLLGGRPWGVGLLGFAPQELLDEQLKIALKFAPNYAIVAGGRPDQVVHLEASGIQSFLHVPSANLVPLFLKEGARKFIFEGRECGGHVGPLSSFVLWSSMVDGLTSELEGKGGTYAAEDVQVLFAGGIHDAVSSAMLQALAAPLVARGVQVGVLMGSAYLFTEEIVRTGAVVPRFQEEALRCERTVNLESGPGHASRCAYTPFAAEFFQKKKSLARHADKNEVRRELDDLILGRLRIASKGKQRSLDGTKIEEVPAEEQGMSGMYMLGQVATLRDVPTTIQALHGEITEDSHVLLQSQCREMDSVGVLEEALAGKPVDIAIVGMGALLPGADGPKKYWENILDRIDAITEVPRHRWDARLYFDENRDAKDKIYSKWGGFIGDVLFDPMKFGMPPRSVKAVDPMQLMALEVAARTLEDAGYGERPFDRERASVLIGASGGTGDLGTQYGLRAEMPRFTGSLPDSVAELLPEWSEDSFAGILNNVIAGRIANRLNFGGANFTTDAACASSLAAVYQGVSELSARRSDFVLAGGVDTVQGPFGYLCFSKTQALSPSGRCASFDSGADGIVISEGIAMVAMKRLQDAERDGDRVYAVIKGIGASSDGKSRGMTAPLPAGQLRAMRRAYAQAGYGADTVGLFEAHGTGTVAGDTAEIASTTSLVAESGGAPHQAVVGSVKTMIGHTKAAAGIAGLLKAVLALHHRVLPPQRGVKKPNDELQKPDCPLALLDQAHPWLGGSDRPRRASVSAFGFGGTNFHITLQEYDGEFRAWMKPPPRETWPSELFVYSARNRDELLPVLQNAGEGLRRTETMSLANYAAGLAQNYSADGSTLCIVASDRAQLLERIDQALTALAQSNHPLSPGVFLPPSVPRPSGKVAVLFSGQGSQYPGMLRELAYCLPVCAAALSEAESVLGDQFTARFGPGKSLSHFIFPRATYARGESAPAAELMQTDVAQPALGAIDTAIYRLLLELGLQVDMFAGHSFGEFVALHAAGAFDFKSLLRIAAARGRIIVDEAKSVGAELGTMAAVKAPRDAIEAALAEMPDVTLANHNAPLQSIISGPRRAVENALRRLKDAGFDALELPVAAAFHSPLVRHAKDLLAQEIKATEWTSTTMPVYSNETGLPHSPDVEVTKASMAEHLVRPVEFVREIERMYQDGARVFVEAGPKSVLSTLTKTILGEREHLSVAIDHSPGLTGLLQTLGQLLAAGVPLNPSALFSGRAEAVAEFSKLSPLPHEPSHAWWINGSGARRVGEPVRQVGVTLEQVQAAAMDQSRGASPNRNGINAPQGSRPGARNHSPLTSLASPRVGKEQQGVLGGPAETGEQRESTMSDDQSVLRAYFETMQMFLQTQERVMAQYMGASKNSGDARVLSNGSRRTIHSPILSPPFNEIATQPLSQPTSAAPKPPSWVEATPQVTPKTARAAASSSPATPSASAPTFTAEASGNAKEFLSPDELTNLLLQVVEEKTGYPRDLLGLSQNLEGDLGIDSIKRVEVVGALMQLLPERHRQGLSEQRGSLNTQATLDGMLKILSSTSSKGRELRPFDSAEAGKDNQIGCLPRYILRKQAQAADSGAPRELCPGHFLITDDGNGVAHLLAEKCRAVGRSTTVIPVEVLAQEDALLRWLSGNQGRLGNVGGVVHAAPLAARSLSSDGGRNLWREELQIREKSFFLLLRELDGLFAPQAHIVALSGLGGCFGRWGTAPTELSLQGGAVGLLKSYSEERPLLRVKAVDLDMSLPGDVLVEAAFDEMNLCTGRQEVGYPEGLRTTFHTEASPLPQLIPSEFEGGIVLATGGARGVTAEVVRGLARLGSVVILTGRRPLPEGESSEVSVLGGESDLRRHFIEQTRSGVSSRTPGQINQAIQSILSDRETLANLADFRSRGAIVEYHPVDVTDAASLSRLIQDVCARHGAITGVVHGAGVIEDSLVAKKTSESWSRVVETKVLGLLNLESLIPVPSLRFFAVFSSVAGRYGNSGQADYATANELMNRLCCQMAARHEGRVRVLALCWGPWGPTTFGAGMVTKETEQKFAEKGVSLVSAQAGRDLFLQELLARESAEIELVFGEGPWEAREAALGRQNRHSLPPGENEQGLLGTCSTNTSPKGVQTVSFRVGEAHAYLTDHMIDGVRVLPAACALELLAESVAQCWPGWKVVEISDFRLLKGIQIAELGRILQVEITPPPYGSSEGFEVSVVLSSPATSAKAALSHYRATVRMEQSFPEPALMKEVRHQEVAFDSREAYSSHLFHGPRFHVMQDRVELSQTGARAKVRLTPPQDWMDVTSPSQGWCFDPGLVDAAPQMAIVWSRVFLDKTSLPVRFGRVTRYADALPERLTMQFERLVQLDEGKVVANVSYLNDEGQILLQIEGMECVATQELNRLARQGTRSAQPWSPRA
jgi:acyl transferase domain-containing protein/NAD(P)H-dependent flavin oxidoreductase YrpB (nitropropane dioxygenase family)/NAD(P)-dependent dehydrogenase (short-subunit alcohol dehydrogenase family)